MTTTGYLIPAHLDRACTPTTQAHTSIPRTGTYTYTPATGTEGITLITTGTATTAPRNLRATLIARALGLIPATTTLCGDALALGLPTRQGTHHDAPCETLATMLRSL